MIIPINIILFLIIIAIFIFLVTSPTINEFVTPSPYQNNVSPIFQNRNSYILENQPILITPSNIKIINNFPIELKINVAD